MALSAPVQLQLDVVNSSFGALNLMKALVNATQVDNVHPAAVLALEMLGAFLTVDNRLIGRAVEVLDQASSYRMETLKLQLGLSVKGVPSQVRKSTPAIKAFLLMSALRAHLDAELVSEILFEIVSQTGVLQHHAVSTEQLRLAFEALQAHCNKLNTEEPIPKNIDTHLCAYLESKGVQNIGNLFQRTDPRQQAHYIIKAFQAISDDDIAQLEIRGITGGFYLATILWWLCRDRVRVSLDDGYIWIPSPEPTPKISIVLSFFSPPLDPELWLLKSWTSLDQPADVLSFEPERTTIYDIYIDPPFIPRSQVYTFYLTFPEFNEESLLTVGTIALALVKAACMRGRIGKKDKYTKILQPHSIGFGDVCSQSMKDNLKSIISVLGWPTNDIDLTVVDKLAMWLSDGHYDLANTNGSGDKAAFLRLLNAEVFGAALLPEQTQADWEYELLMRCIAREAIDIADKLLLRATQHGNMEYPIARSETAVNRAQPLVIVDLLGGKRSHMVDGEEYLRLAMAHVHGTPLEDVGSRVPLVISARGYVAHLFALFKVPKTVAEAFTIVIQPGQLKWKDQVRQCLYDASVSSLHSENTKIATYNLFDSKQGLPTLYAGAGALTYSIQTTAMPRHLLLRTQINHPTDMVPEIVEAIMNWSLAHRPSASGGTSRKLLDEYAYLAEPLALRHPSFGSLRSHPSYSNIMAIEGYFEDERCNFMRYGSDDASALACIEQTGASIPECVIYARTSLSPGWIIMANR